MHVFITTEAGRNPGLFLEWRKAQPLPSGGRVVHARIRDGRWVKVDEWVLREHQRGLRREVVWTALPHASGASELDEPCRF